MACSASANRDPAKWGDDAERARHRARRRATSTCRSAAASTTAWARALARLEGQVAIGTLVAPLPAGSSSRPTRPMNGRIILRGVERHAAQDLAVS